MLLQLLLAVVCVMDSKAAEPQPLHKLERQELFGRLESDARSVRNYRRGLQAALQAAAKHPDLFPPKKLSQKRILSREQKEVLWSVWRPFLDYLLALDSIGRYYHGFYRLDGADRRDALLIAYSAFLARYRWSLELIRLAENDPAAVIALNEPVRELGLAEEGAYDQLKYRYLHVARATEFAAFEAVYKADPPKRRNSLVTGVEEDSAAVWKFGKGQAEALTLKNGLAILKKAGTEAWFPVQAGVSEWMGDTKVLRKDWSLISPQQAEEAGRRLQPGDILLTRREWYLSNVGLPGYWPHAALYVGTPEERRKYFGDPELKAWVSAQGVGDGNFETLLSVKAKSTYGKSREPFWDGLPPRVLEAISEGVTFTSLEHALDADSAAALRPRLSRKEKALALLKAFRYAGRPYDFDFDFATDDKLVCTELVYKAYEPAKGQKGLKFPLVDILGRMATPANLIAKQFDEQFGTASKQLDFVFFYDGNEQAGAAADAKEDEFCRSWRRPKWHILVQDR
ncbi:MAG TPA: hypothetical protein DCM05_05180 [Elusimicrobia bacterium]|nr:hypothetical protein [Elusimicrobiota bacterium]